MINITATHHRLAYFRKLHLFEDETSSRNKNLCFNQLNLP